MPRRKPSSYTVACSGLSNWTVPQEAEFLRRYDAFRNHLNLIVDMPDRLSDLLFRFLHQNAGVLSRSRREKEFAALTDGEGRARIEAIYQEAFAEDHC